MAFFFLLEIKLLQVHQYTMENILIDPERHLLHHSEGQQCFPEK